MLKKSFIPLLLSICGPRVNCGRGAGTGVSIINKNVCFRGKRQGKKNGMLVIADEKKSYIIQMQTKKFPIMIEALDPHQVLLSQLAQGGKMARDVLEIFLCSFSFRMIFLLVQIASENNHSLTSVCRCCKVP